MSIDAHLRLLIDERRLFALEPSLPGISFTRAVLMSPEVRDLIVFGSQDENRASRCAYLRADLEAFASGAVVTCRLTSKHSKNARLARLCPPSLGVFEMRCQQPKPGLRLFGGFPRTDAFLALTWAPRSVAVPWSKKEPLVDEKAWRAIVKETQRSWRSLFPDHFPALQGDDINEIISRDVAFV